MTVEKIIELNNSHIPDYIKIPVVIFFSIIMILAMINGVKDGENRRKRDRDNDV